MVLLGAVVYFVVGLVPFVGSLVCFVLLLISLGAAMSIKFEAIKEWRWDSAYEKTRPGQGGGLLVESLRYLLSAEGRGPRNTDITVRICRVDEVVIRSVGEESLQQDALRHAERTVRPRGRAADRE